MEWRSIELLVKVTFNGMARTRPVTAGYRPHFAVHGSERLLGIEFIEMDAFAFDLPIIAIVKLLYDGADYSELTAGADFEVREGAHVVGTGIVL